MPICYFLSAFFGFSIHIGVFFWKEALGIKQNWWDFIWTGVLGGLFAGIVCVAGGLHQ